MLHERKDLNYSVIQQLLKIRGEYLSVKKNENLLQTKDSDNCFYLLLDGCIDLVYDNDSLYPFSKSILKNEFFGFDELIGRSKKIKTAIALENSELLKLSVLDMNVKTLDIPTSYRNPQMKYNLGDQSIFDTSSIKVSDVNDIKIIYCMFHHANLNKAVEFKKFILDLINSNNKKLIIDLSACKIIDSTFLGSLVVLLKKISSTNGKLNLVCNSDINSWLFVMTKMDKVFSIYQTMDDALNGMID